MHHNDSSSIAFDLKNHSIPKSKFRKVLAENSTIITHEIDKLWLQILEALHIKTKTKNEKSIELILKIVRMFWNAFTFLHFLSRIPIVFYFHS